MFPTPSAAARASASASAAGGFGQDSFQRKNKRRPRHPDQTDGDRGGNPFAPVKADRGENPFAPVKADRGENSFASAKADRGENPFASAKADRGGRQGSRRGGLDRKGHDATGRAKPRTGDQWQAHQHAAADTSPPRPSRSDDPFDKRINDRLRRDGIIPPQWPEDPGDPASSYKMTQFRELYEAYRRKARASLTRAGLIDDPDKRKRLSDAIEFKGICDDMCPEFEKITRITEHDVNKPERDAITSVPRVHMMVKKLARSAAGQEAPLPMDVRSTAALRRSLDYLIDTVLRCDGNLAAVHSFLWDRTRAIRRDFAFFSSMNKGEVHTQVYVLENITRFHVTALHLLSRPGQEDDSFVEQQELEQLGKTLLSLRDLYDDCRQQEIRCENEAEFRAYYLLFHGRDPSIIETLQRQWEPELWLESNEVRTAVSLVEALQSTQEFIGSRKDGDAGPLLAALGAQRTYFRIVQDPSVSYTMACFAECHFPHLRRSILATVKRSLARPKNPVRDVTAGALNTYLRFDTVDEAIQFAQLHRLEFEPDEQNPTDRSSQFVLLNDRSLLPHVRLSHQFSQSLVERKRGQASLPSLIHSTVFEKSGRAKARDGVRNGDSLFVSDEHETEGQTSENSQAGSAETPPSFSFASNRSSSKLPFVIDSDTEDDDATNGLSAPQLQPQMNPFAPNANPFGGTSVAAHVTKPKAPAPRLPTFEEIKAMDSGNFLPEPKRTSAFGQPDASGEPPGGSPFAKSNPFATRLQLPGLSSGNNAVTTGAEKPSPFAPLSGFSGGGTAPTGDAAKTSPFGGAASFASNTSSTEAKVSSFAGAALSMATENGDVMSGNALSNKPKPFGAAPQPNGDQASPQGSIQGPGAAQAKPNPFAALSGSNAATPPAAPSMLFGAPDQGKPADPVAPPVFGQPSAPEANDGLPSGQKALPEAVPSVAAIEGQANALGSAVSASSPFGSAPSVLPSSASQPATSEPVGTPFGLAAPTSTAVAADGQPVQLKAPEAVASEPAPAAPAVPAPPPRDLLADFNKWYVQGDNGLMHDFLIDAVCRIAQDTFATFEQEVEERKRLEEEERINAEVETFRVYNIRLKFFYRWKRNARQKRLREIGRKGREDMRAFYAARRAAEREAKQATADARKRQENRPDEFLKLVRSKRTSKLEARDSLLASGVLSGIAQEREAAKMIVNGEGKFSDYSESAVSPSLESSQAPAKEGPKTRALRKLYFGQPERFRRSLPSMSSTRSGAADTSRASNASSRWRLKAMGIEQLPDGTAVPESLAREYTSKMTRHPRSPATWAARRGSAVDAIEAELQRFTPSSSWREGSSPAAGSPPSNKRKQPARHASDFMAADKRDEERVTSSVETEQANKRKRPAGDDDDYEAGDDGGPGGKSHKRIMSEAEKLRTELRALREDLEKGTEWFKTQQQRLLSESTTGTPWYDDSM